MKECEFSDTRARVHREKCPGPRKAQSEKDRLLPGNDGMTVAPWCSVSREEAPGVVDASHGRGRQVVGGLHECGLARSRPTQLFGSLGESFP